MARRRVLAAILVAVALALARATVGSGSTELERRGWRLTIPAEWGDPPRRSG